MSYRRCHIVASYCMHVWTSALQTKGDLYQKWFEIKKKYKKMTLFHICSHYNICSHKYLSVSQKITFNHKRLFIEFHHLFKNTNALMRAYMILMFPARQWYPCVIFYFNTLSYTCVLPPQQPSGRVLASSAGGPGFIPQSKKKDASTSSSYRLFGLGGFHPLFHHELKHPLLPHVDITSHKPVFVALTSIHVTSKSPFYKVYGIQIYRYKT